MSAKEQERLMGPFAFNEVNIMTIVPEDPGILILSRSVDQQFVLLERAENLRQSLESYLPGRENADKINQESPDRFMFQIVRGRKTVYKLECRWYHWLRPVRNIQHPRFYPPNIPCPVCGFMGDDEENE
jgi:hypothetical protein